MIYKTFDDERFLKRCVIAILSVRRMQGIEVNKQHDFKPDFLLCPAKGKSGGKSPAIISQTLCEPLNIASKRLADALQNYLKQ